MITIAPFPAPEISRAVIQAMHDQIARAVTFYVVESVSGCYLCSLDPITGTSTDSFCTLCSGEYWIPTYSGVTYSGKVTWGTSEEKEWMTGGLVDNGDCLVTILHTPAAEQVVFDSEYVRVDGRELDVDKITLRGVPEVNRILVKLKEKEREE